jgi:cyclopropane fatty-acyl-phospholipid synthase-like methyltransferase
MTMARDDDGAPAGESFDERYWEDRYSGHHDHERRPSQQLVAETAHLGPGHALEAGCGEGANAVELASRGWRVTAVDISASALDHARAYAASVASEVAGRIEWVRADLTTDPLGPEAFDLVTAHYVHPVGPFSLFFRRLAAAVAPGGTLLVVGHDPSDAHSSAHAPADASFTAEGAAAELDGAEWEVEVAETRTGETVEGVSMRDGVLRARRRG